MTFRTRRRFKVPDDAFVRRDLAGAGFSRKQHVAVGWRFEQVVNLPNYITLSRIFAVPLFIWVLSSHLFGGVNGQREILASGKLGRRVARNVQRSATRRLDASRAFQGRFGIRQAPNP